MRLTAAILRKLICCLLPLLIGAADAAHASDWMFRRSYFSHNVPLEQYPDYPLPHYRSAYRRPIAGTTPGFSVRGGYRFSHIVLGSGNTVDVTVLHEDWLERRP